MDGRAFSRPLGYERTLLVDEDKGTGKTKIPFDDNPNTPSKEEHFRFPGGTREYDFSSRLEQKDLLLN
jgi:hypothetical protein